MVAGSLQQRGWPCAAHPIAGPGKVVHDRAVPGGPRLAARQVKHPAAGNVSAVGPTAARANSAGGDSRSTAGALGRGLAAEIFETRDEPAALRLDRLRRAGHRADRRRAAVDGDAIAEGAAGAEDGEEDSGRPKPPRTECPAHLRWGTGLLTRVVRTHGSGHPCPIGLNHPHARTVRSAFDETLQDRGRDFAVGQTRPLHLPKTIRHERVGVARRASRR